MVRSISCMSLGSRARCCCRASSRSDCSTLPRYAGAPRELFAVLSILDGDPISLATTPGMADKKRKFLTFLEEIALLVRADQIEAEVAYYMFGYYTVTALTGK